MQAQHRPASVFFILLRSEVLKRCLCLRLCSFLPIRWESNRSCCSERRSEKRMHSLRQVPSGQLPSPLAAQQVASVVVFPVHATIDANANPIAAIFMFKPFLICFCVYLLVLSVSTYRYSLDLDQ